MTCPQVLTISSLHPIGTYLVFWKCGEVNEGPSKLKKETGMMKILLTVKVRTQSLIQSRRSRERNHDVQRAKHYDKETSSAKHQHVRAFHCLMILVSEDIVLSFDCVVDKITSKPKCVLRTTLDYNVLWRSSE